MLSLDQVRLLENRVEKAVTKIESLVTENARLRAQNAALQSHASELEGLVRAFKDDQGRIETGILNALDRLSAFEDSISSSKDETKVTVSANSSVVPEPNLPTANANDKLPTENAESSQINIKIDADWQNSTEDNHSAVLPADGQMDIF